MIEWEAPKRALYFGCISYAGHFLHRSINARIYDGDVPGFPWDCGLLDGGLLRNRKVPDDPDGRVHWTGGGKPFWFAFFWWDRSGDARGNSCSGFYVQGFPHTSPQEALDYACEQWPLVVNRQRFPLRLVDLPKPTADCGDD